LQSTGSGSGCAKIEGGWQPWDNLLWQAVIGLLLLWSPLSWTFLLAAVETPILGADFLRHFKLLVNLEAGCLVDAETLQSIRSSVSPVSGGFITALQAALPRLRALVNKFPEVANIPGRLQRVKHAVRHVIVKTGQLATARFCCLDSAKLAAAKAEFLQLERDVHALLK
jgi:hypothetical protein